MKHNRSIQFPILIFVFVLAVSWLSSCRSSKNITTAELKNISTGKLIKRVEQNALDYEYLTIKRINCQFSEGGVKTNFKVNLKAQKNKAILVSISKLSFPVGRVLLTPDSVKYVNYMEKNYFVDDYSYLSDVLNIDLDFETIQSIISNNVFSYRNDKREKDFKTFDSFIESGLYVLQSEKQRKLVKIEEKGNNKKVQRRLNRLGDEALILQKMYIRPTDFSLTRLEIFDKTNDRLMEVDFDDFSTVKKKSYPGSINMRMASGKNEIVLRTKMSGFSTDKIKSFSLNIPQKYQQIHVN